MRGAGAGCSAVMALLRELVGCVGAGYDGKEELFVGDIAICVHRDGGYDERYVLDEYRSGETGRNDVM